MTTTVTITTTTTPAKRWVLCCVMILPPFLHCNVFDVCEVIREEMLLLLIKNLLNIALVFVETHDCIQITK